MELEEFGNEMFLYKIEMTMLSYRNYMTSVENNFDAEKIVLQKRYSLILVELQKNKNNYSREYQAHLHDSIVEDYSTIDREFLNRFRSSLIIQLYSFLEIELRKFCELHCINNNKEYSIKDLKGNNDLDKAIKYLKKSANFDINTIKSLWDFISDFRKLRNNIVHHESVIQNTDIDYKSIAKFSKDNFRLKRYVSKTSFIIVFEDKSFLELCIARIEQFLIEIMRIK